jgi:hypothetical protein
MGDAFNGRVQAYGAAKDAPELSAAILRNVYRGDQSRSREARTLADYAINARACLGRCDAASGTLDFGPLPERTDQQ